MTMATHERYGGAPAGRLALAYPASGAAVRADGGAAGVPGVRAAGLLLERCDAEILAAQLSSDPADTFLHAHFAALRAAGAILEARGRAKVRGRAGQCRQGRRTSGRPTRRCRHQSGGSQGGRAIQSRLARLRHRWWFRRWRCQLRAGHHRRCLWQHGQRAEAGTTRLGQAPATPPTTHPSHHHGRAHAARWRRRRFGPRPEPAGFR